jgi:pspC domain
LKKKKKETPKVLLGVCAYFADLLDINVDLLRLLVIIGFFTVGKEVLWAYFLLLIPIILVKMSDEISSTSETEPEVLDKSETGSGRRKEAEPITEEGENKN